MFGSASRGMGTVGLGSPQSTPTPTPAPRVAPSNTTTSLRAPLPSSSSSPSSFRGGAHSASSTHLTATIGASSTSASSSSLVGAGGRQRPSAAAVGNTTTTPQRAAGANNNNPMHNGASTTPIAGIARNTNTTNPSYSPNGGLLFQQSNTRGGGGPNTNEYGGGGASPPSSAFHHTTNDDVECLTTVSNALGAILDDNIALSRDTEKEAVELLDLAVEVFRSAAAIASDDSGGGGGGAKSAAGSTAYDDISVQQQKESFMYRQQQQQQQPPPISPFGPQASPQRAALIAKEKARQRLGVLAYHCGILETIARFLPLRLTIGSKMRVAALKALVAIMQLCGSVDGAMSSFNNTDSNGDALIPMAMRDAFQPPAIVTMGSNNSNNNMSSGGGSVKNPFGGGANGRGVGSVGGGGEMTYSLILLTCDNSGSTSDAARCAAAEALVVACSAWPFLIQSCLLPTLALASHHTSLTAAGASSSSMAAAAINTGASPMTVLGSGAFGSGYNLRGGGGGGGVDGNANNTNNNTSRSVATPSLAVAVLMNAVEVDGLVSSQLRVQLCALTRIIAQHGPRMLLNGGNHAADGGELLTYASAHYNALVEGESMLLQRHGRGKRGGGGSNSRAQSPMGRGGDASGVGGGSLISPAAYATIFASCVQKLVGFLDPHAIINEPLVDVIRAAEKAVNAAAGGESGSNNSKQSSSVTFATNNPRPDGKPLHPLSLTPTQLVAMQQHIRCYVLIMDTLTDLLSSSADSIAAQDYSSYWIEIVAVPMVASSFVRTMDWCLGITTRSEKDLPPSLATVVSQRGAGGLLGGGVSHEVAMGIISPEIADMLNGTADPKSVTSSSSPAAVLTAINEGLLFPAAVSLAKTALLLEGQYVHHQRVNKDDGTAARRSGTAFDGATPSHGDHGAPPLLMYRLLTGLDVSGGGAAANASSSPFSSSATLTSTGLALPNSRVWESYLNRAADMSYFPASWHRLNCGGGGGGGSNALNTTSSTKGGGGNIVLDCIADPTRHHKGIERLRLVRFALSHAFSSPSMHLIEAVVGGNGFQHMSQAITVAQTRLKDQPATKARLAIREVLLNSSNGGSGSASTLLPVIGKDGSISFANTIAPNNTTANMNNATSLVTPTNGTASTGNSDAAAAGGGDSGNGNTMNQQQHTITDALVKSIVGSMDRCTEALLVESSLLLAILFAKSPTIRAIASHFAVGFESWAVQLASTIESVVNHPKIIAGTLQFLVLVDVCQCILNDGEQAAHVDRFDEKRIAAAIVREQEKRRLVAEAEAARREADAEAGEYERYGGQWEHDTHCPAGSEDCGSRYHFRGEDAAAGRPLASRKAPVPTSPYRKKPPPLPTSADMQVFDLDLETVHFLLTQHCASDPNRVYTNRIAELSMRLAKEVMGVATRAALIDGPHAIKLKAQQAEQLQQQQQQNGGGGGSGKYSAAQRAALFGGGEDGCEGSYSQHGTDPLRLAQNQQRGGQGQPSAGGNNNGLRHGLGQGNTSQRRAVTPTAKAMAVLGQPRPMKTNYDLWVAQRSSTPTAGGRGQQPAVTKTIVAALMPKPGAGAKAPFRPTSTAKKRALTPTVQQMSASSANANGLNTSVHSSSASNAVLNSATNPNAPPSVQQLMLTTAGADTQEYLSVAIMMHLPITYGPHYQRSQKATVRHIKSPEGIHYVQPILRNANQSWSAADVFVGEVYVLFLPFHRISIERLTEEIATVQRHLLDMKKKLVTTPASHRSRRWFLTDMLHYVLPRTEMLLTAFRGLLDRYSVADVVYQLSVIRINDESNQHHESVFEAAVESADTAMPREVLRLSSGRFKDVLHSGNLVFAINQLRELYARKENDAAMGEGGGGDYRNPHYRSSHHGGAEGVVENPTRMRDIEREIEQLKRWEREQQRGGGAPSGGGNNNHLPSGNNNGLHDDVDIFAGVRGSTNRGAMGGFGGEPMTNGDGGEDYDDDDGNHNYDDNEGDGGGGMYDDDDLQRHYGDEGEGGYDDEGDHDPENPTSSIARNLLPNSTAQSGTSSFIKEHTSDNKAAQYRDPYSAMDLRRFVSDAYDN